MSLRVRLTLITTVVLTLVLVIFGTGVYVLIDRNLRSRVDQLIEQRAVSVANALRLGPGRFVLRDLGFGRVDTYIQVVSSDGEVITRSEALGDAELPVNDVVRSVGARTGPKTFDTSVNDIPLRIRAFPLVNAIGQPSGTLLIAARLDDVIETLRRLRNIMLFGGLAGIVMAAAFGWRSARTALRPLEEIAETADRIGATGDLSRRVSADREDELGRLAATFNTMLDRLQSAQDALSRTLQTQRRFVDDASHELRTPLTIMRGNLELVSRDPAMAPAEREAALRDAIEEAERMTRLVDDLLALARVDAGVQISEEDVSLDRLVREVGQAVRVAAGDRTVTTTIGDETIAVKGSERLLRRLLENLTDNAIKYTGSRGSIAISLQRDGASAVLTVTDDGVGMTTDELTQAFDRFWRSDWSRERPGSGLGLAIAKAVAEAHGGTIGAVSEPAVGTTFAVRLPANPAITPSQDRAVPVPIRSET